MKKINLWTTAIVLFLGESVALLLSLAIGVYIESSPMTYKSIESWQTILVASLMALSMGIHNSAALSTIPNVLSTTAMTVTIIKTSVFAAQALEFYFMHANMLVLHPAMSYVVVEERLSENFKKFRDHAVVIVAFVGGAITGAALVLQIQLWCLAVPIVAILLLVVDIYFAKRSADAELNAVDTSGSVEELEHDGEATEPQAEQQEEVTVTDGVIFT